MNRRLDWWRTRATGTWASYGRNTGRGLRLAEVSTRAWFCCNWPSCGTLAGAICGGWLPSATSWRFCRPAWLIRTFSTPSSSSIPTSYIRYPASGMFNWAIIPARSFATRRSPTSRYKWAESIPRQNFIFIFHALIYLQKSEICSALVWCHNRVKKCKFLQYLFYNDTNHG